MLQYAAEYDDLEVKQVIIPDIPEDDIPTTAIFTKLLDGIEANDLPAVKLGKSSDLIVGDQVVAIGNPLGELTNSLTVGYVSAKERMVTTEVGAMSMIQTDAAISPGNSGGGLFNAKGELIGIVNAKYSSSEAEGLGFAIPVDTAYEIISLSQIVIAEKYPSSDLPHLFL